MVVFAAVAHASGRCPVAKEPGSNIVLLLAHENCGNFYRCHYGTPIRRACPSGLLFNKEHRQCDWVHNVDCYDRIPPGSTDTELKPYTEIVVNGSSEEDEEIEFQENGCPVNPFISWLVPSRDDCGSFYQCVWGEPSLRNCSSGLHFNPVAQVFLVSVKLAQKILSLLDLLAGKKLTFSAISNICMFAYVNALLRI